MSTPTPTPATSESAAPAAAAVSQLSFSSSDDDFNVEDDFKTPAGEFTWGDVDVDAAEWNDIATEFPQCADFKCPITSRLMVDPVAALDGFTYERAAIEEWFKTRDFSPQLSCLSSPMQSKALSPNVTRRLAIAKFVKLWLRTNGKTAGGPEATIEWEAHGMQPPLEPRRICTSPTSASSQGSAAAAAAGATSATTRASKDMSAALSKVFTYLDPLRDLLASVLDGWTPPAIVVLGDESAGKSTVLEQLAMLPVFPRKKRFCTRLAIHVHVGLLPRAQSSVARGFDFCHLRSYTRRRSVKGYRV
jgi:hypothetical protein